MLEEPSQSLLPQGTQCIQQRCTCLHNGWKKATEDDSSRVTGSTLFDFNGDGSVEVIYNDECFFRIYDGKTGKTLFKEPSESRTRIEHPIVADVDHDGNAEIVFGVSNESGFCSLRGQSNEQGIEYSDLYNAGLEVWGDPQDRWVSARRIWNQHTYHVTNITESGQIPLHEPPLWIEQSGRNYNAYRTQPSSSGIAPDLIVQNAQASTVTTCNSDLNTVLTLNMSATIQNQGDLRVGSGISLSFYGVWDQQDPRLLFDQAGNPLSIRTPFPLGPQSSWVTYQRYRPQDDPTLSDELQNQLPTSIQVRVDEEEQSTFGLERECDEENNTLNTEVITSQRGLADLVLVSLDADTNLCPILSITATVKNQGVLPVSTYTLSLYAGDPQLGAPRFERFSIDTPINPDQEVTLTLQSPSFPRQRSIQPFAMIDADNVISECDESNNQLQFPLAYQCGEIDGY